MAWDLFGDNWLTGICCWWPGSIVSIPNGWHLCDGTDGTPDYRNVLLIGAGDLYVPGQVLGSLTHNHTGFAQADAHNHTGVAQNDTHNHVASSSLVEVPFDGSTDEESDQLTEGDIVPSEEPDGEYDIETQGHSHDFDGWTDEHQHGITVQNDAHGHVLTIELDSHTHTLTVNNRSLLPPCKAGCWIQKI